MENALLSDEELVIHRRLIKDLETQSTRNPEKEEKNSILIKHIQSEIDRHFETKGRVRHE